MEKLFIRIGVLFFFCQFSLAQDTLYVYKTKGTSLLEINKKQSTLKKGHSIDNKSIVKVLPNSEFTSIDSNGNVYMVNTNGTYNFNHLLNLKTKKKTSSFTSKYFKHIWEELKHTDTNKTLIAGVFRGEILMQFPRDGSKIASSKINFKWEVNDETSFYYLFIKEILTDEIVKIETNGSQIALYDDNSIFNDSDTFEWAVTTDAFPNLDNIPFFKFQLIDRNTYEELKVSYSKFIIDLKTLGHSKKEIESILCETYGLCK